MDKVPFGMDKVPFGTEMSFKCLFKYLLWKFSFLEVSVYINAKKGKKQNK